MGSVMEASRIRTMQDGPILYVAVRRPDCKRWFGGEYTDAPLEWAIAEQDARGAAWCKANCHD